MNTITATLPVYTADEARKVHLTQKQEAALHRYKNTEKVLTDIAAYVQLTLTANVFYELAADNDDNDPYRIQGELYDSMAGRVMNRLSDLYQDILSAIYTNAFKNWKDERNLTRLMEQRAAQSEEAARRQQIDAAIQEAQRHNGSKNYATWCVKSYITNDEQTLNILASHLKWLDPLASETYIRNFVCDNFVISTGHHVTSRLLHQIAEAELETIDWQSVVEAIKA